MAPLVSHLYKEGLIEARAYGQNEVFSAALQFAQTEGLLPAPESSHAIRAAIDEALRCKESGEAKTILFGLSGHGHFDLAAYEDYLTGELKDIAYPEEELKKSLEALPQV
jgi:tryptophan synthase beta chain